MQSFLARIHYCNNLVKADLASELCCVAPCNPVRYCDSVEPGGPPEPCIIKPSLSAELRSCEHSGFAEPRLIEPGISAELCLVV